MAIASICRIYLGSSGKRKSAAWVNTWKHPKYGERRSVIMDAVVTWRENANGSGQYLSTCKDGHLWHVDPHRLFNHLKKNVAFRFQSVSSGRGIIIRYGFDICGEWKSYRLWERYQMNYTSDRFMETFLKCALYGSCVPGHPPTPNDSERMWYAAVVFDRFWFFFE